MIRDLLSILRPVGLLDDTASFYMLSLLNLFKISSGEKNKCFIGFKIGLQSQLASTAVSDP